MNTMLNSRAAIVAAALAFGVAPAALAAPVVLDFEGATGGAALNGFYDGGSDGGGASGVNYGISFSPTSLALVDADAGGGGNFGNEPSSSTILFFLSGGAATMNVAAGFDTGFSFFYTSAAPGFVNVYDGLNGSGALLATLNLVENIAGCTGDPGGWFCHFSPVGVAFSGVARSVDLWRHGRSDRFRQHHPGRRCPWRQCSRARNAGLACPCRVWPVATTAPICCRKT